MRRGALIPGLVALVLAVLLARRRWISSHRAPVPVSTSGPAASLPAVLEDDAVDPATAAKATVEPASLAPRFLSIPWHLTAPADEGLELEITFRRSEHMTLDRVDVQETPTQVFVTLIVRWEPPPGVWSAAETEETASVALSSPLGKRELIHGATDVDDADGRPLYP